jgi:hypothetical protein
MSPWKNLEEEGLSRQDFRRNLGMLPVDLKKMTNPEMMLQECRLKITKILQLEDPTAPLLRMNLTRLELLCRVE